MIDAAPPELYSYNQELTEHVKETNDINIHEENISGYTELIRPYIQSQEKPVVLKDFNEKI